MASMVLHTRRDGTTHTGLIPFSHALPSHHSFFTPYWPPTTPYHTQPPTTQYHTGLLLHHTIPSLLPSSPTTLLVGSTHSLTPYRPPTTPYHNGLIPSSPTTQVGSTHSVLSGSSVKVRRRKLKCVVAQWNHLEHQCRNWVSLLCIDMV